MADDFLTVTQNDFLGFMSNEQGFRWFVDVALPKILSGKGQVLNPAGSNLGPVADRNTLILATSAAGANLGLSIPQASLEVTPAPPPAPAPDAPKKVVTDGAQELRDELNAWGLGSLTDQVMKMNAQGLDMNSITAQIRQTDVYKARFKGLVARQQAAAAGKISGPVGSESDALGYEQSMDQMLRTYGLNGYTRDDFQDWYGKDVSVAEQSARAKIASDYAYSEPVEARDAAFRLWGVHEGDLTHYILDPGRALPEVQRRLDAATIAGSATRAGFGTLSAEQAMRIGSLSDPSTAGQQFSKLAQQKALYTGLPGEEGNFSTDYLIAAYFGGDADKLNALRRRGAQRAAEFEAGGSVAQSQKGAYGAGTVRV